MTSLVPGPLFGTPGLNRNSTPTPYKTTPRELDELYSRGDFNGIPWPHDSPTPRVYDVRNSSTKMIILNNKYGQNGTRLRGYYSGPRSGKSEREVNPKRHETVSSPVNMELHGKCHDSSTPRFEPDVKTDIEWVNQSQRPPNSLIVKSTVNPKRHAACQVPRLPNPDNPDSRPVSRRSVPPKRYFTEFPELSVGEKIYLWSIERIYNVDHLKKQKQEQYRKLLEQEAKKGYHGFEEYTKYLNYIRNASKRTFGMSSPGIHRNGFSRSSSPRSRSAVSRSGGADGSSKATSKSGSVTDGEPVRPHTSIPRTRTPAATKTKRAASAKSEGRKHTTTESKHKSSSSPKRIPYLPQRPKSVPALKLKSKSSRDASKKSAKQRKQDKDDNSDTSSLTDKGETTPSLHREGVDRPKSRLGHVPPKEKVIQKPAVKADEYSDDSDHDPADTSISESKTGELKEDTKVIDRKSSTIEIAENGRRNEDRREDATETDHKKEHTTKKDHKATPEFKPTGDVQLDIADETLSEKSRSASSSYEQTEEKTKEHKAPEDETRIDTTDMKSRDNMLFAKLGDQDGGESGGKDVTDTKRDHDNNSESRSVSSASSKSSRPSTADTETSRSVRQEQVEITTQKRHHNEQNNGESDNTAEMAVTEVVKDASEAGENHDQSNSDMNRDGHVFITEPSNLTPKGSQNGVSNQLVNDEMQNENIKRKSDSGQIKESINNAKQTEGENDPGSSMRKLIRQDSLDDDDEERKASKDIDNMKY